MLDIKTIRKICAPAAMAAALAVTLGGSAALGETAAELLPAQYQKAGVLTLATDAKYPPFQYVDKSGKIVGFEVDLWNAIAKRLGVRMDVTSVSFDSLIPGVQSGRWDLAMEAITDNPAREKVVSFVTYGYTTPATYVLKSNTAISDDILSMCGLKGAAQSGTEFVDIITHIIAKKCDAAGKPEPSVKEYGSADAVLLALYSGRTDFVISDSASAREINEHAPKPVRVIASDAYPRSPSGMVIRKDNLALGKALLAAVKEVMADGTYDAIYKKWEVLPMRMSPDEVGINTATSGTK